MQLLALFPLVLLALFGRIWAEDKAATGCPTCGPPVEGTRALWPRATGVQIYNYETDEYGKTLAV